MPANFRKQVVEYENVPEELCPVCNRFMRKNPPHPIRYDYHKSVNYYEENYDTPDARTGKDEIVNMQCPNPGCGCKIYKVYKEVVIDSKDKTKTKYMNIGSYDDPIPVVDKSTAKTTYTLAYRLSEAAVLINYSEYRYDIDKEIWLTPEDIQNQTAEKIREDLERKTNLYTRACELMKSTKYDDIELACSYFRELEDWQDSQVLLKQLEPVLRKARLKEKAKSCLLIALVILYLFVGYAVPLSFHRKDVKIGKDYNSLYVFPRAKHYYSFTVDEPGYIDIDHSVRSILLSRGEVCLTREDDEKNYIIKWNDGKAFVEPGNYNVVICADCMLDWAPLGYKFKINFEPVNALYESKELATKIKANEIYCGKLDRIDEVDIYKFKISESGKYNFIFSSSPNGGYYTGEFGLFSSKVLKKNDTNNFRLTIKSQKDGSTVKEFNTIGIYSEYVLELDSGEYDLSVSSSDSYCGNAYVVSFRS